nr:MAG TPA: hypothetical protein [Caudoviricetes sp.]
MTSSIEHLLTSQKAATPSTRVYTSTARYATASVKT